VRCCQAHRWPAPGSAFASTPAFVAAAGLAIALFLTVVVLNSIVTVPPVVAHWCLTLSKALLLLAVTATAMRSRLDLVMQMGWRAAMPVVAATIASLLVAMAFSMVIL